GSIINDTNDDSIALAFGGDFDLSAFADSVHRIVDEIRPNLVELAAETMDRWNIVIHIQTDSDGFAFRLRAQHCQSIRETSTDVDGLRNRGTIHLSESLDCGNQLANARRRLLDFKR